MGLHAFEGLLELLQTQLELLFALQVSLHDPDLIGALPEALRAFGGSFLQHALGLGEHEWADPSNHLVEDMFLLADSTQDIAFIVGGVVSL